MSDARMPAVLRRAVAWDLAAVRPLRSPWVRALAVAPVSALTVMFLLIRFGVRADLPFLGLAAWGFSSVEAAVGWALVAMALGEAVPGRQLRLRTIALVFVLAGTVVVIWTMETVRVSPTLPSTGQATLVAWHCFGWSALTGMPALTMTVALVARTFAVRPTLAGMLSGTGVGMLADSGWRLFCGVSEPCHVLGAHGGAILALSATGACACSAIDRVRASRTHSWWNHVLRC